jgi:hypothetical protein
MYCTFCSTRRVTDSWTRSGLIHEGTSQCSAGTSSATLGQHVIQRTIHDRRHTVADLGFCSCSCLLLEIFGEWLVVEEYPRVIELVIPRSLQVGHALQHIVDFLISYQGDDGGVCAGALRIVGCIVVAIDTAQRSGRLTRRYMVLLVETRV